jgi:hypothetical protein
MTAHPFLGSAETSDSSSEPQAPMVFVRTLSIPAGMPWDQARIAALEARVGAPLPLSEVLYQLRRLDPWLLGRPARYAAFYIRAREAGADFQSSVDVAGRQMQVRFLSSSERNKRTRGFVALLILVSCLSVLVSSAITAALTVRGETSERLAAAEQLAAVRERAAKAQERLRLQARVLDAAGLRHLELKNFIDDLAWASGAKAPGAHIDAFHWDHGRIAVEVRGEQPPFLQSGRALLRADKPLRPGLWLWGVESASHSQPARDRQ